MTILKMSISASVLILVIMLIRQFTIYRLPKQTFMVLWGIVLCRLLIPFSVPSPFSIYSLTNSAEKLTGQAGAESFATTLTRIVTNIQTTQIANQVSDSIKISPYKAVLHKTV